MRILERLERRISPTISTLASENGQDLVEYALVLALVGFVAIGTLHRLATAINDVFSKANLDLSYQVPKGFSSIIESLDSLNVANIVFNPISRMEADKSYDVYLDLSMVKPLPDLENDLRLKLKGQAVEGHQVQIGRVMEAHLSGDTFNVLPQTPELQAVDPRKTEWRWEVTPTRGGKRNLYLGLSIFVNIDGKPYPHAIETFNKTIQVDVSASRRVKDFSLDHWEWSCGIITAGAVGIRRLWKYRKKATPKFGYHA